MTFREKREFVFYICVFILVASVMMVANTLAPERPAEAIHPSVEALPFVCDFAEVERARHFSLSFDQVGADGTLCGTADDTGARVCLKPDEAAVTPSWTDDRGGWMQSIATGELIYVRRGAILATDAADQELRFSGTCRRLG